MGLLRLLLAIVVMFSHMGYGLYGYHLGVIAVVVFYFLAGQVVARLWLKAPADKRLFWFVRDRALRILPVYYVSLALVLMAWWLGWLQNDWYLSRHPSGFDWFSNLSLLPLNYFMFSDIERFTVLPTAWSLAVEVQFYLLVPLLLSRNLLLKVVFTLSLLVFVLAQVGWLQQDYYGYRLLPGVLWVFLSGALLVEPSRRGLALLWFLWFVCCIYATFLLWLGVNTDYLFEVALGYVVAVPVVSFLNGYSPKSLKMQKFHRLSGAYSYPLFLIHMPIMWLIEGLFGVSSWLWLWVLLGSLIYAMLVHNYIELSLWHRLRPVLNLQLLQRDAR